MRKRREICRGGLMSSSYDAANRLERREQYTSSTLRLAMDYAYTNADDLLSVTRRNGSNTQVGRTTFTYDPAGRVSALRHQDGSNSTFQTLTYSYDAANRVTALIRNSTTASFAYDAANQLTTDGALTFAYDKGGNSTFGPGGTMTYGAGNQLETWGSKNTYYAFEYDDNGNRIERNYIELLDGEFYNQQYGFDHANRLVSFTSVPNFVAPTTQVDYTYDAFGNRIARLQQQTEDEVTTTMSYERYGIDMWEVKQDFWGNRAQPVGNEAANVWVDLDATDSDALLFRRVFSPGWDQIAARLDGSNTARWYLTDRQGSVVGATNESGAPLATITYEAFGKTASGTLIDRYGYTGREWDAAAQLYHYRDRAYDPATRRFLQEDPIELRGGDYNFYRYVGNSPTNAVDPSGLQKPSVDDERRAIYEELFGKEIGGKAFAEDQKRFKEMQERGGKAQCIESGLSINLADYRCAMCHGSLDGRFKDIASGLISTRFEDLPTYQQQMLQLQATYKAGPFERYSCTVINGVMLAPIMTGKGLVATGMEMDSKGAPAPVIAFNAPLLLIVHSVIGTAASTTKAVSGNGTAEDYANVTLAVLGGTAAWLRMAGPKNGPKPAPCLEAPRVTAPTRAAHSAANAARLVEHLRQLRKYGTAGFKELQSGRFRYFGDVKPPQNPGPMAGTRLVREWDPSLGATRTWFETIDHAGRVRIVRPQIRGPKVHFVFDECGNFTGTF